MKTTPVHFHDTKPQQHRQAAQAVDLFALKSCSLRTSNIVAAQRFRVARGHCALHPMQMNQRHTFGSFW